MDRHDFSVFCVPVLLFAWSDGWMVDVVWWLTVGNFLVMSFRGYST